MYDEQIEKLELCCRKIRQTILEVCNTFVKMCEPIIVATSENKRVARLALYARKERVRKKNMKRLRKIVIKTMKRNIKRVNESEDKQ